MIEFFTNLFSMSFGQAAFIVSWIVFTVYVAMRQRSRGLHEAQMIATGLGILGTFVGIVYGLVLFDVSNINGSVPELLAGLSFAFITSIVGMGLSLWMGINPQFFGIKAPEEEVTETMVLSELLAEIRKLREDMAGQGNESVVTQLQKLRTDQNDNHKEIKEQNEQAKVDRAAMAATLSSVETNQKLMVDSFKQFTEEMAKQNMEALISALQKVMEDFNAKINNELKDTFTELTQAAQNLLVWQQKHVTEIENATTALEQAKSGMQRSEQALEEITRHARAFDDTAKKVKESVESMGSAMTGMKSLAESMEGSGKKIEEEMKKVTQQSIQNLGERLLGIVDKFAEEIMRLQRALEDVRSKQQ